MTSASPSHNTSIHRIACSAFDLADRFGSAGPTLLAVWAHPDDESYLGAGLMAAMAERGGRVVNVCATLGEHGTDDPERFPPSALAAIRRRELSAALVALGVEASVCLGYTDGQCAQVAEAMGARSIGAVVDRVEPDVVLTFGHDGVTGHPDHRAIARWVARAVAERDGQLALVTTAAGQAWPDDLVERMHRVDAFYPGYPEHIDRSPMWDVRLTGDLLERKMSALEAHASQVDALVTELAPVGYRRLASVEAYRPANDSARRRLGEIRHGVVAA